MKFLKKLVDKIARSYPPKSETESQPTAPPSPEASAPASSPEPYSSAAYVQALEKALKEQFGKDVKVHWLNTENVKLPEFRAPSASAPVTPPAPASALVPAMMNEYPMKVEELPGPFFQHEDLGPFAEPERSEVVTRLDRANGRTEFLETLRFRELLSKHFNETKVYFWDPQCDLPLEADLEKAMWDTIERMGPENYIEYLMRSHNVEMNPKPVGFGETVRAARKLVRGLKIYEGEKYHQ